MRNHTQNVLKKPVTDPFLRNQNWEYLWIRSLKIYTVCFCCMASWGLSKYIETKLQTTRFHLMIKLFLKKKKKKRGLELVPLFHFLHNFCRKVFSLLYSINRPNCIVWLPLLCEILGGNMCIATACKPGCDVMNFKVNLTFPIKPLFIHDQKVVAKT